MSRAAQVLRYPLSKGGILTCVFLGFMLWIGTAAGLAGAALSFSGLVVLGLLVTTAFGAIRDSANGGTSMPDWGHYRSVREDVVKPGVKAMVLAAVVFAPAAGVWLFGGPSGPEAAAGSKNLDVSSLLSGAGSDPTQLSKQLGAMMSMPGGTKPDAAASTSKPGLAASAPKPDVPAPSPWTPQLVVALVLCGALFPLALLVLAVSGSLLAALNPVVWMKILGAAGAAWIGVLAGLAALAGLDVAATWPLHVLAEKVMIFPSIVASTIDVYLALCGSHLLGGFLFANASRLGWTPETRVEMSVDRVRQIKEATLAEIQGRRPTAGVAPDFAFNAALGAGDVASAESAAVPLVDAAFEIGDNAAAAAYWRQLAAIDPRASFDPPRQSRIARALEAEDPLGAAVAWYALASRHPAHAQTPRALFRAGECYTKAKRPDLARPCFAALVEHFPMDEAAALARARLK